MKINSNHCNNQFKAEIVKVEKWLKDNIQEACGYSQKVVIDRLMQFIVSTSLSIYTKTFYELSNNSSKSLLSKGTVIDIRVASLELETGKVFMSLFRKVKQVGIFLVHWFVCLLAIIFIKKCHNNSNIVLVYGVGEDAILREGTDEQFVDYCNKGKISPLRTNSNLYIEFDSDRKLINHHNYYYCNRPLISALRSINLGLSSRVRIFICHVLLFFQYLVAVTRSPQVLLLSKEIAYSGIVKELDRYKRIEAIVFTCSNYLEQPIWVRELVNATVHMAWYAQAWRPNTYKVDKLESHGPNLPWIRVDTHWVWTNKFAEYLFLLGLKSKFEVVGSILWYLPTLKKKTKPNFQISIFDISPFSDEVALECGQITNYNNPNNLFAFLDNTIEVINNIGKELSVPIEISLKQKRSFKSVYSKEYYSHVEQLSNKGIIELVNPSANIYEMISSCHVVIAYPFTSPVYVANELNVPSIFYDPTDSICNHNFSDLNSLIDFVSTKKLLHESILSLLIKSSNN